MAELQRETEGKIKVKLGAITFSGKGDQEWLGQQLDKILEAAPELGSLQPLPSQSPRKKKTPRVASSKEHEEFTDTLASYIKAKGGDRNQVKRFLATADWLRRRGEKQLTTAKVSKALRENHQKGLSNPADCLNKNVGKGNCEKNKDGFFITPDGLKELGHKL